MFEIKEICCHEGDSQYWAFRAGWNEAGKPMIEPEIEDGFVKYEDSLHQCSSDLMAYNYAQRD